MRLIECKEEIGNKSNMDSNLDQYNMHTNLFCWISHNLGRTNVDWLTDQNLTTCASPENSHVIFVAIPIPQETMNSSDASYSVEVAGELDMTCGAGGNTDVMVAEDDGSDAADQCDKEFRRCHLFNHTALTNNAYCQFSCLNWPAANTEFVFIKFRRGYGVPCDVKIIP